MRLQEMQAMADRIAGRASHDVSRTFQSVTGYSFNNDEQIRLLNALRVHILDCIKTAEQDGALE